MSEQGLAARPVAYHNPLGVRATVTVIEPGQESPAKLSPAAQLFTTSLRLAVQDRLARS